jgi:hypothetical protein
MTPNDFDSFSEVVTGFAELKGKVLSPAAIKLFWNAMQHWPIEDFRAAAGHLVRSCEFMPTPKDFEDLRKAGRPTSGEAWIKARETARRDWGMKSCGNPLIDRAVRAIGGFDAIGMCDTDKMHFLERRFCEHFEAMQESEEVRQDLPQITTAGAFGALDALVDKMRINKR